MADHGVDVLLAFALEATFRRAGAELADTLGAAVDATADPAKLLSAEDLEQELTGPCLVVSGSLAGAVQGPIVFVFEANEAARFAARARQTDGEEADGQEPPALSPEDTAAVAFALARVGAAGTAVWEEQSGREVRWPAEATELTATPTAAGEAAAAVVAALGQEQAAAVHVALAKPADVAVRVVAPAAVGEALARLIDPEARWGGPAGEGAGGDPLGRVLSVELAVQVVVARRTLAVRELLELLPGRVLDLEKRCDEPLELYVGSKLVARGEPMLVDDRFGFRVGALVYGSTGEEGRHKLVH